MNLVTAPPKPPSKWETFRTADGLIPSVAEYDARFPPQIEEPEAVEERRTKVIFTGKVQHRASSELDPTPKQIDRFMSRLVSSGDHLIFRGGAGQRHAECRLMDGTTTLVSAARFYWHVRHPRNPFTADDLLVNHCNRGARDGTGDGLCLTHLRKETRES